MGLSLRFKIIFITVIILIFAIGATAIASIYVFAQSYSDLLQSRTIIIAQGINSQLNRLLELGLPLEDITGFESQLQETLDTYDDISYAMVVDLDGTILFHNDPSQQNTTITDAATLKAVQSGQQTIQVYASQDGEFQEVFVPIVDRSGHTVGAIRLGFPTGLITERLNQLAVISGAIALIALTIATILLIFALTAWVTNPLTKLLAAIQQMSGEEQNLVTRVEIDSRDELGELGAAFNTMAARLNDLIETLEQRVAERTHGVETVAALNEKLAAILNLEELLQELVDQVQAAFGYYYIHAYLLDDREQNLIMTAGIGQVGREMKQMNHRISVNEPISLVARVARNGQIARIGNVHEAEDWRPNPLLPDTVSEMAVPIILEGKVVGVLDVQEDEIAGLDESDASLLRLLANQVAVAIRNARQFNEVGMALREAHVAQERYLEQSWDKTKISAQVVDQYLYERPDAPPLDAHQQQLLAQTQRQAPAQKQPVVVEADGKSLVTPVILHDRAIGALQLYTSNKGQSWTEDDLTMLEAIAVQFAQSAENLRLFEETRERASREATIREITEKVRAAPSLEALMETTARELGQLLGVRRATLEMGLETESPGNGSSSNGNDTQEAL